MAVVVHHLSVHHHQHFHVQLAAVLVLHEYSSFVPWDELVLIWQNKGVILWRFGHVLIRQQEKKRKKQGENKNLSV